MPAGKLLTHAPMNALVDQNATYWNILAKCNGVDFLNVQYYNNPPDPLTDLNSSLIHYQNLVNGLYGGDATKVLVGLCISDCSKYNANSAQAASVTKSFKSLYPTTFGGIMDWAENQGDIDGSWSGNVVQVMRT